MHEIIAITYCYIKNKLDIASGAVILLSVLLWGQSGAAVYNSDAVDTGHVLVSGVTDHGYSQIKGFELVSPVPVRVPFDEGEYLLFAIQYGLIYAGDATLEVRNIAEVGGRRAYHIVSEARTNKTFDVIFKVRDRHESFVDWERLHTLRFEKHLREGRFRRDHEIDFDQIRHQAIYAADTVGIPPNTQDFLSALYFFRTVDIEPGQAMAMVSHTNGKNYPIFIKVLRRERVSVTAGEFDCIVIEPVLETTTIFENTGKLTIWMTDDTVRMPVMMRSKVIVGSFEAVLKEYTPGAGQPRILEVEGQGFP